MIVSKTYGYEKVPSNNADTCNNTDDYFIEEAGTMNIFVHIINLDGQEELITPVGQETILNGIIRDSILEICQYYQLVPIVSKRDITIVDIIQYIKSNRLLGMFGTGTASGVVKIINLWLRDKKWFIPSKDNLIDILSDFLEKIQRNDICFKDWTVVL